MLKAIVSSPDAIPVNTSGLTNLSGNNVTEVFAHVDDKLSEKITNPMTTAGDIIIGGDAGTADRLGIGSDGDVLTLASGVPSWAAPAAGGSYIEQLGADVTVTVGSGGDYATINAALEALSKKVVLFKSAGITATVSLLTGFKMEEQVFVVGADLSFIKITSVDATVTIGRDSLTTSIASLCDSVPSARYPAFAVTKGGRGPTIGCLFNMDTAGTATNRDGLFVCDAGSFCRITGAKGFTNAGGFALSVFYGGCASAASARLSGNYGIYCGNAGTVNASSANCSGCTAVGVGAAQGAVIDFSSGTATGYTDYGVYSSGGFISAASSDAQKSGSPTSEDFVVANGGIIAARFASGGVSQTANTLTASGIIFR